MELVTTTATLMLLLTLVALMLLLPSCHATATATATVVGYGVIGTGGTGGTGTVAGAGLSLVYRLGALAGRMLMLMPPSILVLGIGWMWMPLQGRCSTPLYCVCPGALMPKVAKVKSACTYCADFL